MSDSAGLILEALAAAVMFGMFAGFCLWEYLGQRRSRAQRGREGKW